MTPLEQSRIYQRTMHPFAARLLAAKEAGVHVSVLNREAAREAREAKKARLEVISTVPEGAWWMD